MNIDDESRSIGVGRSAVRTYDPHKSAGKYYDDDHRRPFRQRGGFARWYGNHGRTGDLEQSLRRSRVVAALGASGFSINGAAKIVGCSWHTVKNDMQAILGHERSVHKKNP